jgi:peptidyl-dipeptidase A
MNLPLRIYDRIIYFASQNTFFKESNDAAKLTNIENSLNSIYASAKVCENKSDTECFSLEPEITELMANSRDYNRLLNLWKGWHDVTGNNMKSLYKEAVAFNNKKAKENGYKDLSVLWLEDFEDDKFEKKLDKLFNQIKPLYEQLHAYVRRKLKNVYGKNYPSTHNQSLIPAHLLGNMWGQTWENIYDLVVPYPNVKSLNLTKILIEKKYTPIKMFQVNLV